jgi:putative inorganic carbon (hco3(-)) transporter
MSHWMTFGGQEMIVLLMLGSMLFFAPQSGRRRVWLWVLCGAILGASVLAGFTRSIWLATGIGGVYLLWFWRKWTIAALPVLAALVFLLGPASFRARVLSIFEPHGEMDSNQHRVATRQIALNMIKAHPVFGLGPENVKLQYERYVPGDASKLPGGWYGHLHNIYLHYAAERGIPAMLALIAILGKALYDFWRALRRLAPGPSEARFVLHAAISIIIAILVSGWYELNLGDSEVLMMFLVVISSGYLAVEAQQEQNA